MPGLSTTMAMMLLIGLSAGMPLDVALAFMLGVYNGSTFGGAVSAVLINIPGTPDSIPTMMEGYPLAKQGKGGEGARACDHRVVSRQLGRHRAAGRVACR